MKRVLLVLILAILFGSVIGAVAGNGAKPYLTPIAYTQQLPRDCRTDTIPAEVMLYPVLIYDQKPLDMSLKVANYTSKQCIFCELCDVLRKKVGN